MSTEGKQMLIRFKGDNFIVFNKLRKIFNLKTSDNIGVFKRIFMLFGPIVSSIEENDVIELIVRDVKGREKEKVQASVGVLRSMSIKENKE